jgi:hypothetical protein
MLAGLNTRERSTLNARLFSADIQPLVHPDDKQHWCAQLDYTTGYNVSRDTMMYLRRLDEVLSSTERCYRKRPVLVIVTVLFVVKNTLASI